MKLFVKILGFCFLLAGLLYFANIFTKGGTTSNIITLLLRFTNAVVWIVTGYGFIRLMKWSIYGLVGMTALYLLTVLYNNLNPTILKGNTNLLAPAVYIIIFLFLFTYRKKIFNK